MINANERIHTVQLIQNVHRQQIINVNSFNVKCAFLPQWRCKVQLMLLESVFTRSVDDKAPSLRHRLTSQARLLYPVELQIKSTIGIKGRRKSPAAKITFSFVGGPITVLNMATVDGSISYSSATSSPNSKSSYHYKLFMKHDNKHFKNLLIHKLSL